MPLKKGNKPEVISQNISELTHHGSKPRSHEQIVAIAVHKSKENEKPAAASAPKKSVRKIKVGGRIKGKVPVRGRGGGRITGRVPVSKVRRQGK